MDTSLWHGAWFGTGTTLLLVHSPGEFLNYIVN